ncbi:unnamed protein product, partial [Closterium sp. NIES-53]
MPTSPISLTHSSIPQSSACHPSLPPHPFSPLAPLGLPPPPSSPPPRSLTGRAIFLFLNPPFSTSPNSPLATPGLPPPPSLPSRPPQGHSLGGPHARSSLFPSPLHHFPHSFLCCSRHSPPRPPQGHWLDGPHAWNSALQHAAQIRPDSMNLH